MLTQIMENTMHFCTQLAKYLLFNEVFHEKQSSLCNPQTSKFPFTTQLTDTTFHSSCADLCWIEKFRFLKLGALMKILIFIFHWFNLKIFYIQTCLQYNFKYHMVSSGCLLKIYRAWIKCQYSAKLRSANIINLINVNKNL